jgi:nucleotide-binding universal stress UspA family protein
MDKKLLIGVDGSNHALWAVDYVGLMSQAIPDLSATIYHVAHSVPPPVLHGDQHDAQNFRLAQRMQQLVQERAFAITDKARERLTDRGFAADRIKTKALSRGLGLARDLVFEGTQGLYDAIVLGRRGLSKAQELFLGSVTNKVVQHADRLAVWVVGGKVKNHRILCAVDSSRGSLRAVDYLALMLTGSKIHEVTLFHAGSDLDSIPSVRPDEGMEGELAREMNIYDKEQSDNFNTQARQLFEEHGLDSDSIRTLSQPKKGSVSNAILKEATEGNYGTVVLGRRGEGGAFWLGHVSDKVLAKASDLAVWVIG